MDYIGQSRASADALPAETILQEKWKLKAPVSTGRMIITYLAESQEDGSIFRIAEYMPEEAAVRAEDGVHVTAGEGFKAGAKRFRRAANILSGTAVPHLPQAVFFEENGTAFCAFPWTEGKSLADTDFPRTASYLRSLGIALCDTYTALHREGLCCGRLSASGISVQSDGSFLLQPETLLEAAADTATDRTEDMHILTAFLSVILDTITDDGSEELSILRNVLQYSYQDAELLREALICEENSLERPRTHRSSAKPVLRAMLCLAFLLSATAGAVYLGRNHLPMGVCMKLGLIQPDVISVWMPMETTLDETQTQEMYQKLVNGFERKYAGYGVDLVIFADDSFEEALTFPDGGAEPPTVFMNSTHDTIRAMSADLHLLTASLEDSYLADMTEFDTSVPLGCSLTALYYNAYSFAEPESETIDYAEISPEAAYDATAAPLIGMMETETTREEGSFSVFLDSRTDQPFLASTSCLALAEKRGITSGAVRMLPVSADGSYPLQYEMYCTVNAQKDWNSQRIGMLWIQYLLTEEAQQIMFAEYYSALPMHSDVLPQTIENHDALSVVGRILPGINTQALQ